MTAFARLETDTPTSAAELTLTEAERATLDALRRVAATCRAARRFDPREDRHKPEEACAACDAPMASAVRAMTTLLGRPPRFYAPGTAETGFDERWLIALLRAERRGDRSSLAFLTRSRVARPRAREAAAIVAGLAPVLDDRMDLAAGAG